MLQIGSIIDKSEDDLDPGFPVLVFQQRPNGQIEGSDVVRVFDEFPEPQAIRSDKLLSLSLNNGQWFIVATEC